MDNHGVIYGLRDIKSDKPTAAELKLWHAQSAMPLRRFWNTSGLQYRSLGLKDRLSNMGEEEQINLLSSDGMLVKRPILLGDGFILVGFKETEWEETLLK